MAPPEQESRSFHNPRHNQHPDAVDQPFVDPDMPEVVPGEWATDHHAEEGDGDPAAVAEEWEIPEGEWEADLHAEEGDGQEAMDIDPPAVAEEWDDMDGWEDMDEWESGYNTPVESDEAHHSEQKESPVKIRSLNDMRGIVSNPNNLLQRREYTLASCTFGDVIEMEELIKETAQERGWEPVLNLNRVSQASLIQATLLQLRVRAETLGENLRCGDMKRQDVISLLDFLPLLSPSKTKLQPRDIRVHIDVIAAAVERIKDAAPMINPFAALEGVMLDSGSGDDRLFDLPPAQTKSLIDDLLHTSILVFDIDDFGPELNDLFSEDLFCHTNLVDTKKLEARIRKIVKLIDNLSEEDVSYPEEGSTSDTSSSEEEEILTLRGRIDF